MSEIGPQHLRRFGEGPRDVLALHCTLAHGGSWRGVADALSGHVSLLALDLPGHGRNTTEHRNTDLYELCMGQAAALLSHRMDLAGHSFGAVLALRLALEFPQRVRSLTLVEPVLFAAAKAESPAVVEAYEADLADFGHAFAAGDRTLAARLFNRYWGDGTRWDDFPEPVRAYMTGCIDMVPRQAPALVEDTAGLLHPGRLEALDVPVLLIEGEETAPVIRAVHDVLAARLTDVRRIVIPGARHMAVQTHPDAVAAGMRALFEVAEE